MNCYSTRIGRHYVGGIFITSDGFRRMIPDDELKEAKFEDNILRLNYSTCVMEVSGYRLEKIFDDATIGKLGTLTVAVPADNPEAANDAADLPFITSIIHIAMTPQAASDMESEYEY